MSIEARSILPEELLKELDAISVNDVEEPTQEVGANEHEEGVLDWKHMRILGLLQSLHKKIHDPKAQEAAARYIKNGKLSADRPAYMEVQKNVVKYDTLNRIYHFQLMEDFDLWGKPNFDVRKGFKVVWSMEGSDTTSFTSPDNIQ